MIDLCWCSIFISDIESLHFRRCQRCLPLRCPGRDFSSVFTEEERLRPSKPFLSPSKALPLKALPKHFLSPSEIIPKHFRSTFKVLRKHFADIGKPVPSRSRAPRNYRKQIGLSCCIFKQLTAPLPHSRAS